MNAQHDRSGQRGRRGRAVAFAMSLVIHASVLAALALRVVDDAGPSRVEAMRLAASQVVSGEATVADAWPVLERLVAEPRALLTVLTGSFGTPGGNSASLK